MAAAHSSEHTELPALAAAAAGSQPADLEGAPSAAVPAGEHPTHLLLTRCSPGSCLVLGKHAGLCGCVPGPCPVTGPSRPPLTLHCSLKVRGSRHKWQTMEKELCQMDGVRARS